MSEITGQKPINSFSISSPYDDFIFLNGEIFIEISPSQGYSEMELDTEETKKLYEAMKRYYED